MKSKVYFIDLKASYKENFLSKIGRLLDTSGLGSAVKKRDFVAVKMHFGNAPLELNSCLGIS